MFPLKIKYPGVKLIGRRCFMLVAGIGLVLLLLMWAVYRLLVWVITKIILFPLAVAEKCMEDKPSGEAL
jgi:Flp pilus assembly protein TadB